MHSFILSYSNFSLAYTAALTNFPLLTPKIQICHTIEYIINHVLTDRTNPRISVKDPCRVCHKTVKVDYQAILCKSCEFLVYIGCNGITQIEYDHLQHNSESWNCLICNIKNNLYNLPFTQCDNTLLAINDTFNGLS